MSEAIRLGMSRYLLYKLVPISRKSQGKAASGQPPEYPGELDVNGISLESVKNNTFII